MFADALALELRELGIPAQVLLKKAHYQACDEAVEVVCNPGKVSSRRIWVYFDGIQVAVEISGCVVPTCYYDLNAPDSIEQVVQRVIAYYNYIIDPRNQPWQTPPS